MNTAVILGAPTAKSYALSHEHGTRTFSSWVRELGLNLGDARMELLLHKSSVPSAVTTDPDYSSIGAFSGIRELRTRIARQLVLGRMDGAFEVPFNIPTPVATGPASAAWVRQGFAAPVTRFSATTVSIPPRKVQALTVVSGELLRAPANATTDQAITRILTNAVVGRVNATLLSDDAEVSETSPEGLLASAETVPSTGNTSADLEALIDAADDADVDMSSAVWIMRPSRAAGIAAELGVADLGFRSGGSLLGAPVVTDRAAGSTVFLIAADRLAYALGSIDVDVSETATVLMDDAPNHNSVPPTPSNLVSLYQTDSVAFLVSLFCNWDAATDPAVFALTEAES